MTSKYSCVGKVTEGKMNGKKTTGRPGTMTLDHLMTKNGNRNGKLTSYNAEKIDVAGVLNLPKGRTPKEED